jgi:hypothetical protein
MEMYIYITCAGAACRLARTSLQCAAMHGTRASFLPAHSGLIALALLLPR